MSDIKNMVDAAALELSQDIPKNPMIQHSKGV